MEARTLASAYRLFGARARDQPHSSDKPLPVTFSLSKNSDNTQPREASWYFRGLRRACIILIVLLIVGGGIEATELRDIAEASQVDQLLSESSRLALSIEGSLESADLVLSGIALDVNQRQRSDPQDLPKMFAGEQAKAMLGARISGLPQLEVAMIVSAKGKVLASSRDLPTPGIDAADQNDFEFHRQLVGPTGSVHITAPLRDPSTGAWTFYMSRWLIDRSGNFLGVAAVGFSCEKLEKFLGTMRLEAGSEIHILGQDDIAIASAPGRPELLGQKLVTADDLGNWRNNPVEPWVATNRLGNGDFRQTSEPRIAVYRHLNRYPILVREELSGPRVYGSWSEVGQSMLTLLGGIVGILLLGLAVISLEIRKRHEQDAADQEIRLRAEAAIAAKSRFLAVMSHEIRTPLTGILGFTELLLEEELDPIQREFVMTIHESGESLRSIVNDVLDFSQIESGQMVLNSEPFDMVGIAHSVVALFSVIANNRCLILQVEEPDTPAPQVVGDTQRLRQVLSNLVSNAIRFTSEGSVTIRVSYALAAKGIDSPAADADLMTWRIEVIDTGIGMTQAEATKLFQPYVQINNTLTRSTSGTGLGLVICRRLIDMMGGQIGVTSTLESGSNFWFTVTLPVAHTG